MLANLKYNLQLSGFDQALAIIQDILKNIPTSALVSPGALSSDPVKLCLLFFIRHLNLNIYLR